MMRKKAARKTRPGETVRFVRALQLQHREASAEASKAWIVARIMVSMSAMKMSTARLWRQWNSDSDCCN